MANKKFKASDGVEFNTEEERNKYEQKICAHDWEVVGATPKNIQPAFEYIICKKCKFKKTR